MAAEVPGPDRRDAPPGGFDDGVGHDPGLARERTQLAWSRTTIAFAAVGVAILRTDRAVGAVVVAMSAAVWVLGRLPGRERAEGAPGRRLTRRRTVQLITAATTLVSLVALALTVRSYPHP
jgi:uncharacterized membrane protein YidH (DUF202 family)